MELLFIFIQILINIIISSIINTKNIKAGNPAEYNRHSAGGRGGEEVRERGGGEGVKGGEGGREEYGITTGNISNRYMLSTSD